MTSVDPWNRFDFGGLTCELQCSYVVRVADLQFEWDEAKAEENLAKHGVSFVEATRVFEDERARLLADPDHSEAEDRFILLGLSWSLRVLVVVHCYRSEDEVIRIISARKATRAEVQHYTRVPR